MSPSKAYKRLSSGGIFRPAFIEKVEIYRCRCEVDLHFSYGHIKEIPFLVCAVKSGSSIGLGEVLSDNYDALKKGASDLLGRDFTRLDGILPDSVKEEPGVRECLSMAVYDTAARHLGVPLYMFLGGKKRDEVPLMPMLFAISPQVAAEKARLFKKAGYEAIRVKIFGDAGGDISLLESVRKAAGKEYMILADANQGYKSLDEAIDACREFDKLGISVVEDPLKGNALDYAKLRKRIEARVMVSALSAFPFRELREVIEEGSADVVNHNPCQLSSLSEALRVNHIVEGFGLKAHVGGVGFFGIGTAVYQQLASVIGLTLPCGEVGGWIDHGYPEGIVRKPYPIIEGKVKIPDVPGTGMELVKKKLQKYLEASEVLQ